MVAVAAPRTLRLTPSDFCARLLSAAAADRRGDAREHAQQAVLLRPFVESDVEPSTFEAGLESYRERSSDLADTAREILTLWRLCSR